MFWSGNAEVRLWAHSALEKLGGRSQLGKIVQIKPPVRETTGSTITAALWPHEGVFKPERSLYAVG